MPQFEGMPQSKAETPKLVQSDLHALSLPERKRVMMESAQVVLESLQHSGAIEYTDVNDMYRALGGLHMMVRREAPEKVQDLIEQEAPITISFPEGERYSNAVTWTPAYGNRGIENAYLEGYAHINGVVMVIGFHANDSLDIEALPDASQRFAGLDREYVRSIAGTVSPEDLYFVSVRIPLTAFPYAAMTEDEKDRYDTYIDEKHTKPEFIHRGYLFTKNLKQQ